MLSYQKGLWNLKKWHPRFTKVALASLTVLILIPGLFLGADKASASSVPGEPVYWIKKSKENIKEDEDGDQEISE